MWVLHLASASNAFCIVPWWIWKAYMVVFDVCLGEGEVRYTLLDTTTWLFILPLCCALLFHTIISISSSHCTKIFEQLICLLKARVALVTRALLITTTTLFYILLSVFLDSDRLHVTWVVVVGCRVAKCIGSKGDAVDSLFGKWRGECIKSLAQQGAINSVTRTVRLAETK